MQNNDFFFFFWSGDSEGLYEQLPVEAGHGPDDGSISPTGFIDGPPLSPSDDSELYASVFNQENGEHLVKPSQIKNRRSLQAGTVIWPILVILIFIIGWCLCNLLNWRDTFNLMKY